VPENEDVATSNLTVAVAVIAITALASALLLVLNEPAGQSLVGALPEPVAEAVASFVALKTTQSIAAHILLNWLVAMFAATHTGTLEIKKIADFLWMKVLPLVGTYFFARLLAGSLQVQIIHQSAFALIEVRLLSDLVGNLKLLGIEIPDDIASLFDTEALAT
jgi:hypothetical protein